jgi:hypothetical protein
MLVGGEKFWVGGAGIGGGSGDRDWGVDIERDGREADLLAAGLVAKLEGNFLRAERGVGLRSERYAQDDFVFVNVQRSFGEGEGVELALRIRDFAGRLEASGEVDSEIGGDEVFGGRFARVDVEAIADFEHDGELKGAAAGNGLERNVCGGSDDFAAGRDLRLRGG